MKRIVLGVLLLAQLFAGTARASGHEASVVRYGATFFADKAPKTALDMVNLLPGFSFSAGDASVRGYAGAASNVLIDGARPSDKQFALDQVLARIPADQVDFIEVIRGGAPGIEMLDQTVVANVVRRKNAGNSLTLSLSNAQFIDGRNMPSLTLEGTRSKDGRSLTGAVSVSKYVELAEGDGPQTSRDATGNVIGRETTGSKAGGVTAYGYGAFETPAWGGKLRLNTNITWTDYTETETDLGGTPSAIVSRLHEHLGGPLGAQLKGEAGGHFNRSFGDGWTSESAVLLQLNGRSYTSVLNAPGLAETFVEHDHGGEALANTDLRYAATPTWTIEGSFEGAYNWLGTTSGFSVNGAAIALPNARADVSEVREEAMAKSIWTIGKLVLEVGARVENSTIAAGADTRQRKMLTYPKPRLALTLTPDANNQLRFRFEREVGQLDFSNFVAASALDTGSIHAGNAGIVPQQQWTLEAAYERRFWSGGDLVLTLRHEWISDAIDRVPVWNPSDPAATFDAPGNIGAGFEDAAIADLTLPLDRLGVAHGQFKASATLQGARVTDPTTGARRAISGLNPAEYSISFRQDLPRWRADWGLSLATPCATSSTAKGCAQTAYRFNEIDVYHADPAFNVFAEYQPWPGTSLRFEADNILGRIYDRVVQIYAGPRDQFALSHADERSLRSSPSLLVSLRKAF